MSVSVLSWLLGSPFLSFVFLPCLLFFGSYRFRSPAFFLPIRRSVLPSCVSLHVALLFLLSFQLVHSCFRASLPSLWFVCMSRIFLVGFLSFASFRLRFFLFRVAMVFPCWCLQIAFGCFSLAFADQISLSFSFPLVFIGLTSAVSSCFVYPGSVCRLVKCFIFLFVLPRLCAVLSSSLPLLSASLSFILRWFPAEFSGLCLLFSFPV